MQFKPGVAQSQVDSLTRAFGLGVLRPPRPDSGFSYYVFSYPRDSVAPLRVAVALDRNPLVAWADPDKISNRHPDEVPSDPYFSLQYYLSNTNTLNGIPVDDNVETAWDLTTGLWPPSTGGLRVGVIGTGVQASHPEFGGRVLDGYDAVLGNSGSGCTDCATSPYGNDYHETSVAGIIVGQHDGSGIAGIAPGVFIVPARIFRGDQVATDVGIADAIYYTWYYGAAEVINNSWGGGTPSDAITNAINSAATSGRGGAGTVVVFAAGNTSNRDASQIGAVDYPAYLDTVIAVGAIDRYGYLTNYTPEGSSLDIVAPSGHYTNPCVGDVVTTDLLSTAGCNDGPSGNIDYTSTFSGTSAAAPQVAAVAALVIARQSSLSMSAVKNRLYQGADYWGPSTQFGWGKLNAYKSVTDVTVVITGTKTIRSSGDYSWNCSATGGNGTYSYRWDESDNQGPYYEVGTSSTYSDYVDVTSGITTIDLRCTVTSGVETGVGNFRANVIPR